MFTMNASAGTSHSHVRPSARRGLEPEPRIELRVPDDDDERTPLFTKPLQALRHELATDPLTLICRSDRHRPECRPWLRPHGQRAEQDVTDDGSIRDGNQGERDGPGVANGIDNAALLLLIEGLPVQFSNGVNVRRLFFSDLNHSSTRVAR